MILLFLVSIILSITLIFINSSIFKKMLMNREKLSAFECGFDPKNTARLPFSIRFYIIAVIFLIFDIEIALILPIPSINSFLNLLHWSILSIFFIIILLTGLFHEWNLGVLNWSK